MAIFEDLHALAKTLPRSSEAIVRGRVKFRIGRIVWLAFSRDRRQMGLAFPKEWRNVVVSAEPEKFIMPSYADLLYNWLEARLSALDDEEMHDLVLIACRFCVATSVAEAYDERTRSS